MSKLKETKKSQNQTDSTIKRRSFNEWIDMIYSHIENRNQERYGFNTSLTVKT